MGSIAGCYVLSGKVIRNASARVFRDGKEIFSGKIASLKRFKDDAKEVASGYECGIVLDEYKDVQEGDVMTCFKVQEVNKTL